MRIPGFVYTALITGLYAFLQALAQGIQTLQTDWWIPVAVAGIGAVLKALDMAGQGTVHSMDRDIQEHGVFYRWLFG